MQVSLPGSTTPFSPSIVQVRVFALAWDAAGAARVGSSAADAAEAQATTQMMSGAAPNLMGPSCVV